MKQYFIKLGYRCNLTLQGTVIDYKDDEHNSSSFQINVYKYARKVIIENKLNTALDVGCGFGLKLKNYISPVCQDIVGIDSKHAINYCRREHKFGHWIEDDIENPKKNFNRIFDVIIVSDVIEHLIDPDKLFEYLYMYSKETTHIIVSTPERDLFRGSQHEGPAPNVNHAREWNLIEFRNYLISKKAKIIKHFLVGEKRGLIQSFKKICLLESLKICQVAHFHLNYT